MGLFGFSGGNNGRLPVWVKVVGGFFGFIFFVIVFLYLYGTYRDPIFRYFESRREAKLTAEIERVRIEIEEAYKNDFDGGKTPEETIDMFVSALKVGDIEKASKYYELSVQPKALAGLEEEKKKYGNLDKTIAYVNEVRGKGVKGCNDQGDGCTFKFKYIYKEDTKVLIAGTNDSILYPKGSSANKVIDLSVNDKTGVWKITQPY